jgi:hypothetical protein
VTAALYAHAARLRVWMVASAATLASEDLDWRRDNNGRILERLFNVNVYYKAYRKQRLDQQAELARWRALGVRTLRHRRVSRAKSNKRVALACPA